MMVAPLNPPSLILVLFLCLQSLADAARQEAERRQAMDQQGIEAKVIDSGPQQSSGRMTISSGVSTPSPRRTSKEPASTKGKTSIDGIRATLQKLDRSILETQARLESRRTRLNAERWVIPKSGRISSRNDAEKTQNRLKQEMEELQKKLERLQQERSQVYDLGRKAGFLPGELTGKGIIP